MAQAIGRKRRVCFSIATQTQHLPQKFLLFYTVVYEKVVDIGSFCTFRTYLVLKYS